MNTTEVEIAALKETTEKMSEAFRELSDLQLVMIGGGAGGETILA